LMKQY